MWCSCSRAGVGLLAWLDGWRVVSGPPLRVGVARVGARGGLAGVAVAGRAVGVSDAARANGCSGGLRRGVVDGGCGRAIRAGVVLTRESNRERGPLRAARLLGRSH